MKPEIYWHIGLGRTATTFTQTRIFPKLKGVYFIPKKKFHDADEIIHNTPHQKILLTHENSRNLTPRLKKFAGKYPDARIIVVFRRQDTWIASHYRRMVKNGYPEDFNKFYDFENDQGHWKKNDLYYMPLIESINQYFKHKPLLLFHNDLKSQPDKFLGQIMNFLNIDDHDPIDYSPTHISYNDNELKVRRWVERNTFLRENQNFRGRRIKKLIQFRNKTLRYAILYTAKAIPEKWINKDPLIPPDELKRIKEFYADDWQRTIEYARKNNEEVLQNNSK
ncbi:MAG: sulfotransferase domain-containing protein [Bacteroidota bacterium]